MMRSLRSSAAPIDVWTIVYHPEVLADLRWLTRARQRRVLVGGLRRRGYHRPRPGWASFLARVGLAAVVMAFAVWFAAGPIAHWFAWSVWSRIAHLATILAGGALVYLIVLALLGLRPRHLRLAGAAE